MVEEVGDALRQELSRRAALNGAGSPRPGLAFAPPMLRNLKPTPAFADYGNTAPTADHRQLVYSNGFDGSIGGEWSNRATAATPSGAIFLGPFGNELVTLSLGGLEPHTVLEVRFKLFIIHRWQGNDAGSGPDAFRVLVQGGPGLLDETFSNVAGLSQSHPGGGSHPHRSGSSKVNRLGFDPSRGGDSVYDLRFLFAHSDAGVALEFAAIGLEPPIANASWGIDGVRLYRE